MTTEEGPQRVCDMCAVPDDELIPVKRVYLLPETWDTPASERVEDPVEVWCVSCMSQYPHQLVDD